MSAPTVTLCGGQAGRCETSPTIGIPRLTSDVFDNRSQYCRNLRYPDSSCRFDFKAVFDNGKAGVRRNVNVCEISTFTYKP